MYSMTLISVKGKLSARFYENGKAFKTKGLGVSCTTSDLSNPNPILSAIISKYNASFNENVWKSNINGGNPYNLMFGNQTNVSFQSSFKGTNFYEYTGELTWGEVTSNLLYEYKDHLEADGYAANTIKKYLNQVKLGLDKARECGAEFPTKDYARILKSKRGTTTSIYLTRQELNLLASVEVYSEVEQAVKVLALLSARTGARFSDTIRLNLANLEKVEGNVNQWELIYVSQKTTTPTRVPLHEDVEGLIKMRSIEISNNKANLILPELCRRAGISGMVKVFKCDKEHTGEKWEFVRTHTMRKSFATNVYLSGMYDLRSISKMMGHALVETTSSNYIVCGIKEESGVKFNYFKR